jgi:4-hydroxybutyrate CoA-transferase
MHAARALVAALPARANVFVHTAAAVPQVLTAAWAARLVDDGDAVAHTPVHLHTEGAAPWLAPEAARGARARLFFVGPNARGAVAAGRADVVPARLSEAHHLMPRIDVALISLTMPNAAGMCSLGPSVDVTADVLRPRAHAGFRKPFIVAQLNARLPWVPSSSYVALADVNAAFVCDEPLPLTAAPRPRALDDAAALEGVARGTTPTVEAVIAARVAALVPDGACLQVGIGSVPDAVCAALRSHRRLGVHTEMLSDGLRALIECGAVDNSRKAAFRGGGGRDETVASFAVGTTADAALEASPRGAPLYDWLHHAPQLRLRPASFVNDPAIIAANEDVVAINSAIEVDVTGQVCADSVGSRVVSGPGGQLDFAIGAAASVGGRGRFIIVLPSTTVKGRSRVVASLAPGAGVVTPRACVDVVVSEWGTAFLRGASLGERALAMIAIAHPAARAALTAAARKEGLLRAFDEVA